MNKLKVFPLLLVGLVTAGAQAPKSPAGEPPLFVRNGQARPIGRVSPQQKLRLAIGLEHPRLAEEERFLEELANPNSPGFHKFLTADEWNARFAPAPRDEQAVVDWARGQGLTITHRFANRLIVDVEGTVDAIEGSLQVRINQYQHNGFTYFANERAPALPAAIAGLIHSITGLSNMEEMQPAVFLGSRRPGPAYLPGPAIGSPLTHHADGDSAALAPAMARSRARATGDSPSLTGGAYDPTDMYNSNLYSFGALQNLGWCCNPDNAAGGSPPASSIAIAAFGGLHTQTVNGQPVFTDINGYQAQYPYLAFHVTTITVDGGPIPCTVNLAANPPQPCSDDVETTLDTEMAVAYANSFGSYLNSAHVYVYQAPNNGSSVEDVYNTILSDGHARVFSTSWDCAETAGCISSSAIDTRHGIFNSMAGQGWTVLNSSGDRGATSDCATTVVNYPASDPNVTAVGGTLLQVVPNPDGSLNRFGAEVAWTGGNGAGSCKGNNGGSGGGCSGHFSRPGYQDTSNGSCGAQRSVPDIALNSAAPQNFYFNGSLGGVGGTSVASPMMAGFFAQENAYLIHLGDVTGNNCGSNHNSCGPVGWANPLLYYFGKNPNYAPHYPFYDITSGCNTNDITAATPSLTFYCAGTGYDSVTGWGSSNMLQLAWAFNSYLAGSYAAPTVAFSGPASGNFWYRTPQTLNWTLSAASDAISKPNGIAGFSQAWDTGLLPDSIVKATPGSGDSFYNGPQFPNATTGYLALDNSLEGCHIAHVRTWDNGGTNSDHTYGPLCYDDIPPSITCQRPDGVWHPTDVSLACSATDSLSGLANNADASFNVSTFVSVNVETDNAFTNGRIVYDLAGNSINLRPIGGNRVDKKAPAVTCGSPDGLWHASDVSIACTATDGGSGLSNAADASFTLSTSVATGAETASANTNSRTIADMVGNSSPAGPIGPNKVDKKPPVITITQPAAATYTHSSTLALNYSIADGGSGLNAASVAPTMDGNSTVNGIALTSGSSIYLLTNLALGNHTFVVNAADNVGNKGSASVTFTIVATPQSMITDVSQFWAAGGITDPQVYQGLLDKLNQAASAYAKAQCTTSGNDYQAIINQVMGQAGKGITATAAAILIGDAQYLMTHCPQ